MRRTTKAAARIAILCCAAPCLCAPVTGCTHDHEQDSREYGVFLGIDGSEADRLKGYDIVVIEPSGFSANQIDELHADGTTVYGYLNIGALEEWRPYHDRFQDATLGAYEDWPDERWMDATSPAWQEFIVNELGKEYANLGLDGFFLDNADVYHHYPADASFEGLLAILEGLKANHGLPLIVNGGDDFVSRCIDEGVAANLIDEVNQETVFTSIDFERKTYGERSEEERAYWQEYLAEAKASGLSVYLLEYGADQELAKRIDAYCRKNGFLWYDARDLELR